MKTLLRALGLLLLLALAGGGWVAYEAHTFLTTAPETPGRDVFFDVPAGARLAQGSAGLVKQGLVTDARKLDLLARYKKWENRLQAGRFALNTGWLPEKVLDEAVRRILRVKFRLGLFENPYIEELPGGRRARCWKKPGWWFLTIFAKL